VHFIFLLSFTFFTQVFFISGKQKQQNQHNLKS